MFWLDHLPDLADGATAGRGRAYADRGQVIELAEDGDRLSAVVRGTDDYRVELVAGTRSWSCDCPVGATGAFCKHCVAVAFAASGSDPRGDGDTVDLAAFDDGPAGDAVTVLADEVARVFRPRRRFYDYTQANTYADEAEATVRRLEDRSRRAASAELLAVLQTAIDHAVRAILRSDDSSGAQNSQIARLLDAHRNAAAHVALDREAATKLVRWLFRFMFDGRQDFFEIDIDKYADAVGPAGIELYRRLLDDAGDLAPTSALRHARGRLAILSRDPDEIVAHFRAETSQPIHVTDLVDALDDAGHAGLATECARMGVAAHPGSPFVGPLVERLVLDARQRGAVAEVARLLGDDFGHRPSTATYAAFERAAIDAGTWAAERDRADPVLAAADPRGWVSTLLRRGDSDAAWSAAETMPERIDLDLWRRLFRARVRIDPASTLPHYRRLVDDTLVFANRGNYQTAARLLRSMRDAAAKAGRPAEFDTYLADLRDRYRRRRALDEELRRAGL